MNNKHRVLTLFIAIIFFTPVSHSDDSENTKKKYESNIQKKPAYNKNHGGLDGQRQHIQVTAGQLGNHDDFVGKRTNDIDAGKGSRPNIVTSPKKPNVKINCKHPMYLELCNELKKAAGKPITSPKPEATMPRGVWLHTGSRSNYSVSSLRQTLPVSLSKQRPRSIRFNGDNNLRYNFNGNSFTIRHSQKAPSSNVSNHMGSCFANNTGVSACTSTVTSTYATGCMGNTVKKTVAKWVQEGSRARCSYTNDSYKLEFNINKIEVMY